MQKNELDMIYWDNIKPWLEWCEPSKNEIYVIQERETYIKEIKDNGTK